MLINLRTEHYNSCILFIITLPINSHYYQFCLEKEQRQNCAWRCSLQWTGSRHFFLHIPSGYRSNKKANVDVMAHLWRCTDKAHHLTLQHLNTSDSLSHCYKYTQCLCNVLLKTEGDLDINRTASQDTPTLKIRKNQTNIYSILPPHT